MADPTNLIGFDNPPEMVEITVELGGTMATQLKAVSLKTGLSKSALVTLGLQKILPEQKVIFAEVEKVEQKFTIDGKEVWL